MSAKGHKRTHAPQQITLLFDHLVRRIQKARRHSEAERLGGLEGDYQLELGRSLHRQIGRLRPLEDAIDIGRRKLEMMALLTSVGQQTAELSKETPRTDGWQTVASSQRDNLHAMDIHEAIRHHDQATIESSSLSG